MNTILFYVYLFIGYAMVWMQVYGADKFPIIKNNEWFFVYTIAPLIAYFMVNGSKMGYMAMDSAWSIRLISFSINMTVFTIFTYFLLNETMSLKNLVCLGLALVIIMIQILWK